MYLNWLQRPMEQLCLQSLAVTSHTAKNPWPGLRSICPGGDNFQFPGDDCLHFKLCKQKNYPHSRPDALVTIFFTLHSVMLTDEQSMNIQYNTHLFHLSTIFMSNSLIYFFESAGQDGRGLRGGTRLFLSDQLLYSIDNEVQRF